MASDGESEEQPFLYQLIGDNLDIEKKIRHQTNARQNPSYHIFNVIAIRDKVSGNHLPDKHVRRLKDVCPGEFLFTEEDVTALEKELVILWERALVRRIPGLACLKDCVIRHIPHQYSNVMSEITKEVSLLRKLSVNKRLKFENFKNFC